MKKRTSRLLSVLLTLVMVLGLIPALGTTAFAARKIEPIHLELKSGENVFDSTKVQDAIADMTGGKLDRPGHYSTYVYNAYINRDVYGHSYDTDKVSSDGVAKSEGGALYEVRLYNRDIGKVTGSFEVVLYVNSVRIDQVEITGIDAPVAGQPLDMTAECSTPGIESATVKWYTLGEDSKRVRVNNGAVAKAGTVYLAHVSVTPAIGYDLAGLDNITVTVNGAKATPVDSRNRNVDVTYQFPATGGENSENQNWVTTKKIISEVAVTGVVTPVDGAKPVETCKLGGTGYALKSMSWYDGSLKMNSAGTFQAGKTYRACFYLLPEKGYTFDGADSMTATVNGKTVEVTNVYGEPEQRGVTIDFTCEKPSKTISTVDITELDALKPGTAADYTASTSTPGCTVKKVEYQMFQKIMTNYVPADGENIAVVVTVSAADGYEFASGSTATWNGLTSDDTVAGLNANEKRYAFYIKVKADASQIVKSAAMTISAPEIGKAPSTAVTGNGVEASDVKWSPADATFQAGTAYTISFTLKADATHVLADDFKNAGTVTVNGQKATLTSSTKGKFVTYTVSYTFPVLKAGAPVITTQPKSVSVKEGADVTFTVTAEGEGLSYQWYCEKNGGAAKVGTNGPTYTIKAANVPDDNGTVYYCVIHNKAGEATSEKATLTVSKLGAMTTFSDVPAGVWYTAAVDWAVEEEITNGTGGGKFSPTENCTHAQILTFLYRADRGVGTAAAEDMDKAVDWARGKGMIDASFNGAKECTRAEAVEYIWQALGKQDAKVSSFADVDAKAGYARAVDWAVDNGVTNGAGGGKFSPNTVCTRGHIVTFLHRAYVPEARV